MNFLLEFPKQRAPLLRHVLFLFIFCDAPFFFVLVLSPSLCAPVLCLALISLFMYILVFLGLTAKPCQSLCLWKFQATSLLIAFMSLQQRLIFVLPLFLFLSDLIYLCLPYRCGYLECFHYVCCDLY